MELAGRLLADAWVVERLEDLPAAFTGIAATRTGRVWFAAWGEVRQLTEGGEERVLARRNERDRLIAASELAVKAEQAAQAQTERILEEVRAAEDARAAAEVALREAERARAEGSEARRRTEWLIEQRKAAPQQGPLAVRKAQLEGELAVERRQAERVARERAERAGPDRAAACAAHGRRRAGAAGRAPRGDAAQRWRGGRAARGGARGGARERPRGGRGDGGRAARLRRRGGRDPGAAARGGRGRDRRRGRRAAVARPGAGGDAGGAGGGGSAGALEPRRAPSRRSRSSEEQAEALAARVERLRRRREQLGPVNPLAQEEYAEAVAHVEELEGRRSDLETALRELKAVIRETDKQIEETFAETFAAAARNFEELAGDVFPGGSGRLKLVRDEQAPRPVLGGQRLDGAGADGADGRRRGGGDAAEAAAEAEAEREAAGRGGLLGDRAARRRDRDHAGGEVGEASVAALGRGEVDDRARVPVRGVPREAVSVLHPRRGRGRARRSQPRPLPRAAAPLRGPRAVHRDHPSEAHDGGRRLAVRRVDGRRRRLEGALTRSCRRARASAQPAAPEVAEVA